MLPYLKRKKRSADKQPEVEGRASKQANGADANLSDCLKINIIQKLLVY